MAAIKAGEAYIQTSLRGGDKLRKDLKAITGRLKGVASAGAKIAAVGLAAGASAFAAFSVKAASDLEETMNKFNVVFGENAAAVKKWGDAYASQIGRSEEQIARFLSNAQDLLVPLGFEEGAATQMSQDLTILSTDLASFNNMADSDVMRDLQAALTGSGEVMKKYGVIVSEAAVKQELLNQGLDPKIATNQQKVMARYNLILAGTTAAQGDATRSAGSFANQVKALQGKALDFAANVGSHLLPILSAWIDELFNLVSALGPLPKSIDNVTGSVDGLGNSSANTISPIEALVRSIAALTTGFKFYQLAITDALIAMTRFVTLAEKVGKIPGVPNVPKSAGQFASNFREELLRNRKSQFESLQANKDIAFGSGYKRLTQRGQRRRDAARGSAVGISGVVDSSGSPTPSPPPVVETPLDRAASTLNEAAIALERASNVQRTTAGTFGSDVLENLISVQQQRQLSNREKELELLKRQAQQGKDANSIMRQMLQEQRERIGVFE